MTSPCRRDGARGRVEHSEDDEEARPRRRPPRPAFRRRAADGRTSLGAAEEQHQHRHRDHEDRQLDEGQPPEAHVGDAEDRISPPGQEDARGERRGGRGGQSLVGIEVAASALRRPGGRRSPAPAGCFAVVRSEAAASSLDRDVLNLHRPPPLGLEVLDVVVQQRAYREQHLALPGVPVVLELGAAASPAARRRCGRSGRSPGTGTRAVRRRRPPAAARRRGRRRRRALGTSRAVAPCSSIVSPAAGSVGRSNVTVSAPSSSFARPRPVRGQRRGQHDVPLVVGDPYHQLESDLLQLDVGLVRERHLHAQRRRRRRSSRAPGSGPGTACSCGSAAANTSSARRSSISRADHLLLEEGRLQHGHGRERLVHQLDLLLLHRAPGREVAVRRRSPGKTRFTTTASVR